MTTKQFFESVALAVSAQITTNLLWKDVVFSEYYSLTAFGGGTRGLTLLFDVVGAVALALMVVSVVTLSRRRSSLRIAALIGLLVGGIIGAHTVFAGAGFTTLTFSVGIAELTRCMLCGVFSGCVTWGVLCVPLINFNFSSLERAALRFRLFL